VGKFRFLEFHCSDRYFNVGGGLHSLIVEQETADPLGGSDAGTLEGPPDLPARRADAHLAALGGGIGPYRSPHNTECVWIRLGSRHGYLAVACLAEPEDALSRAMRINKILAEWQKRVPGESSNNPLRVVELLGANPFITRKGVADKLAIAFTTPSAPSNDWNVRVSCSFCGSSCSRHGRIALN
jgi:hypothetical protein